MENRIFLLSPASVNGKRAGYLLNPNGGSALAKRMHGGESVPIGEVFSFLSGLYFRGKLTYADAFARPTATHPGRLVITTERGLIAPQEPIALDDLRAFDQSDVHTANSRYTEPLARDAAALACDPSLHVVLLGSVATGKYVDILMDVFGDRLLFPIDFVGRGDLGRGGLLLKAAREGRELPYAPVAASVRHGRRAPRIADMAL